MHINGGSQLHSFGSDEHRRRNPESLGERPHLPLVIVAFGATAQMFGAVAVFVDQFAQTSLSRAEGRRSQPCVFVRSEPWTPRRQRRLRSRYSTDASTSNAGTSTCRPGLACSVFFFEPISEKSFRHVSRGTISSSH